VKVKHLTSWAPDQLKENGVYETEWTESSYWTNKQIFKEDDAHYGFSSFFEKLEGILSSIGTNMDFSLLSNELRKTKYNAELLKEYIFEDVRKAYYPQKPSRQKCLFLFPWEVEALDFAKKYRYDLVTRSLLELELLDMSSVHFADMTLLDCNVGSQQEKIEAARKYWEGTNKLDISTEILYTGKFKITKIKHLQTNS